MDHLTAYQCLEVNFHHFIFQMIDIYFLDQNVHVFAVHIKLDSAALAAGLKKTVQCSSFNLYRNGTFDLFTEYVTGYKTFPSQSFRLDVHASFFSF